MDPEEEDASIGFFAPAVAEALALALVGFAWVLEVGAREVVGDAGRAAAVLDAAGRRATAAF